MVAHIITDETPESEFMAVKIDGDLKSTGCVPRDYAVQPLQTFADPDEIEIIPESEVRDRVAEMNRFKAQVCHMYDTGDNGRPIPAKDQDGDGYCWAYSVAACLQAQRAIAGQPYKSLSAHAVAAVIKRGANEGGWCGLSCEFVADKGIPEDSFWREHSRDWRRLWTPECQANAKLHRMQEGWFDVAKQAWDRKLTKAQIWSCLLRGQAVAADFAWWGHSIMLDEVLVGNDGIGFGFMNSWGPGYGERGRGQIWGQRTIPMGAIAARVVRAA